MKKSLWMLGVAVAALTSCTQNEVVDAPERPNIKFESFVGKASRNYTNVASVMLAGAGPADNDLNSFWVYGKKDNEANLFENTEVSWDANNQSFSYTNPQQWYEGNYNFSAYSDGNNQLASGVTAGLIGRTLTFTDYVNNGVKDLVAAIPETIVKNETNMSQGVKFNFKHMLACIELNFTNASSNFALDLMDAKFSANSVGTCVFSGASSSITWSDQENLVEYEFKTNDYDPDDQDTSNDDPSVLLQPGNFSRLYCFVIPQANTNIELSFKLKSYERKEVIVDGTSTYEYHYSSTDNYKASLKIDEDGGTDYYWDPGRLYRYTADIIGQAHYINFSVQSVENWNAAGNVVESDMNESKVNQQNE